MTFNQFVQKLYTHCGNGNTQPNFLRELFCKITNAQEDPIFEKDDDYLSGRFMPRKPLDVRKAYGRLFANGKQKATWGVWSWLFA